MKKIFLTPMPYFFSTLLGTVPMPPQMPIQQPAPQTTQPLSQTTPQPAAQATVQTTVQKSPQTIHPEFEQIATSLAQLQAARNAIADAMKELDDKMQQARSDTAQAKKISLSILNKTNESEAKEALDQVNALLQKLQSYQADIQNQTSKTIDQNYNQMQTQFATIQEKIRNLQSKNVTFHVEQAQQIAAKAEPELKELQKTTSKINPKEEQSKSMIHSFFAGIADWIMAGGRAIHTTYRTIIEYLAGPATPPTDADQKKKSNTPATVTITPENVRNLIGQCDQISKNIELSYISLQERSLRLEEAIATWGKTSPVFARLTKLDANSIDTKTSGYVKSKLKSNIVAIFSWLLDGVMAVVDTIVWGIKIIYNTLFAGIVNKFFTSTTSN